VLRKLDAGGAEGRLQDGHGPVGIAGAAHEDVDGDEVPLRLGVDRDMGFGEHDNAGNAAAIAELVQMRMQHGGPGSDSRLGQRRLNGLRIGEVAGTPQVEQQVAAGIER